MTTELEKNMKINEFYNAAIRNEYQIDLKINERNKVNTDKIVIARYDKLKRLNLEDRLLIIIIRIVMVFWWSIHFCFTLYLTMKTLFAKMFSDDRCDRRYENLVLVTNNLVDRLYKKNINEDDAFYLNVPWVSNQEFDAKTINLVEVIKLEDIFWSFIRSIKFKYFYRIENKNFDKSLVLQTYDSFYWFLLYRALKKLNPKKIYFANHYDRWAILVDKLVIDGDKFQIQHGIEDYQVFSKYKLLTVKRCFCFDDYSTNIFKKYIHSDQAQVEYIIFSKQLETTWMGLDKTILFVGGPADSKKELDLIKEVANNFREYTIFIKPHPVYSSKLYRSLECKNVTVIERKNIFPMVKAVISYKSTLAFDYEKIGVKVVYHLDANTPQIILELNRILLENK